MVRGRIKLKQATEAFSFDFRGKTVLDIGSSTGGFTEYALERGASKVIAIEKGTNQMMEPLKNDSRVELHEKTNIFGVVSKRALEDGVSDSSSATEPNTEVPKLIIESPDVILADVSFISLKKVLSYVKKFIAAKETEFLVMLKPQFEANSKELLNGIVKNEKIRRNIIKDFEFYLKQNDFIILKKHDNELAGKNGNRERFYLLKLAKSRILKS
ncbi:hypothetical protein IKE84_00755 [Candidatus Saccharibacteria bacterium]|nr:hypothetical protein [Candidatus Saccharibacteria bacterium]